MHRILQLTLCSLAFLTLVACKGPELRRLNRQQVPVRMAVGLPAGLPDRTESEFVYTRGLQAALSQGLVPVAPDSATPAPLITVEVAGRFNRASLTRDSAALGGRVALNFAVMHFTLGLGRGETGNLLGNSTASGLGVGLFSFGVHQLGSKMEYNSHCKRLGYEPSLLKARVSFLPLGGDGPVQVGDVDGLEIVARMRVLPEAERNDPAKRLEEEGRALGLAVWDMLSRRHALLNRQLLPTKRS